MCLRRVDHRTTGRSDRRRRSRRRVSGWGTVGRADPGEGVGRGERDGHGEARSAREDAANGPESARRGGRLLPPRCALPRPTSHARTALPLPPTPQALPARPLAPGHHALTTRLLAPLRPARSPCPVRPAVRVTTPSIAAPGRSVFYLPQAHRALHSRPHGPPRSPLCAARPVRCAPHRALCPARPMYRGLCR